MNSVWTRGFGFLKGQAALRAMVCSSLVVAGVMACTPKADAAPKVAIVTNMGKITVELDANTTPKTTANFLQYVGDKFYDGTIFHRVISGFMVQGGGFTADMAQKPTKPAIALEAGRGLSNKRGTIAMARTAAPDSATSQFFINHANNARLDSYGGGYAVFGKVLEGMDVVDKIAGLKTQARGAHGNVPMETVTIESVRVVK